MEMLWCCGGGGGGAVGLWWHRGIALSGRFLNCADCWTWLRLLTDCWHLCSKGRGLTSRGLSERQWMSRLQSRILTREGSGGQAGSRDQSQPLEDILLLVSPPSYDDDSRRAGRQLGGGEGRGNPEGGEAKQCPQLLPIQAGPKLGGQGED